MGKRSGTTSREVFSLEDNLVSCLSQDGVADRLAPPPLTFPKQKIISAGFTRDKNSTLSPITITNKSTIKLLCPYTCVCLKKKTVLREEFDMSFPRDVNPEIKVSRNLVYGKIENLGNKAAKANKFTKKSFYTRKSVHDHFCKFKLINGHFGIFGIGKLFLFFVIKQLPGK